MTLIRNYKVDLQDILARINTNCLNTWKVNC